MPANARVQLSCVVCTAVGTSSSSSGDSSSSSSSGRLSTAKLVGALLEAAGESPCPVVIFLRDRGSAVLRSSGACEAFIAELDSHDSRTLVLLSTVSDGRLVFFFLLILFCYRWCSNSSKRLRCVMLRAKIAVVVMHSSALYRCCETVSAAALASCAC
jgi:hypothetical protein